MKYNQYKHNFETVKERKYAPCCHNSEGLLGSFIEGKPFHELERDLFVNRNQQTVKNQTTPTTLLGGIFLVYFTSGRTGGRFTSGQAWTRSDRYVSHTGTARPLSLSLSTRSMTAACEGIIKDKSINQGLSKASFRKRSSLWTWTSLDERRKYPGAKASKWLPGAVGFPDLHSDDIQKDLLRSQFSVHATSLPFNAKGDIIKYRQLLSLLDHKHKRKKLESWHRQELKKQNENTVREWLRERFCGLGATGE